MDELIEYKTEELSGQLTAHRQEIARVNAELVRMEAKATADYLAQLDSKLKLKQKELEAHIAIKPKSVEQPNNLSLEQQAAYAEISVDLEKQRAFLSETDSRSLRIKSGRRH